MIEISDIELFEKAERGDLSKDKKDVFVRRLTEDSEFKAHFEKYKGIISAIKQQQHYEELMVVLNESYKSKDWSAPAVEIESTNSSQKQWIIAAILILIAIVATFFIARSIYGEDASLENETAQSEVIEKHSPVEHDVMASDQSQETITDEAQVPDPVVDNTSLTAFMIANSGYFMTQYSAVSDARSLRLRQNDTIEYKVDLVAHDSDLDIAVLRFAQEDRNALSGVPFRLATTQAFANTEVMLVGRNGELEYNETTISALESEGSFKLYELEMDNDPDYAGAPVISKNGNIVAIGVLNDGVVQYVKSTHIVGMLARSTGEPGMEDYIPSATNRLAGLGRPDQVERITPYILEVIKFY